mmetsp:Transcript_41162/g.66198  ORF Transcript_41162/g.66198 Transcript_41162/m.66198 type:complete len:99 (+) Transcript_41162:873-1169(+)
MSRGNAALDQTSTYPALQNVLKQSNVDSKVSSILKSFSDILCQKVCDGFYLLDGNVPIYVAVMEDLIITRTELGWEFLRSFVKRHQKIQKSLHRDRRR